MKEILNENSTGQLRRILAFIAEIFKARGATFDDPFREEALARIRELEGMVATAIEGCKQLCDGCPVVFAGNRKKHCGDCFVDRVIKSVGKTAEDFKRKVRGETWREAVNFHMKLHVGTKPVNVFAEMEARAKAEEAKP